MSTNMLLATPKSSPRKQFKGASVKDKERVLQMFDMELDMRIKDLQNHLETKLQSLMMYSNNQITRLSGNVRGVTLREFGEKFGGDMSALVRGMATQNVLRTHPPPSAAGKRKRDENADDELPRLKAARQASTSPKKLFTPVRKATGASATPSSKRLQALRTGALDNRNRPMSTVTEGEGSSNHAFPHSSSFDPQTSTPLPQYPRPMRPDETLMSKNGSPVANPFLDSSSSSGGSSKSSNNWIKIFATTGSSVSPEGSSGSGVRGAKKAASSEADPIMAGQLTVQMAVGSGRTIEFNPDQMAPNALASIGDLSLEDRQKLADSITRFADNLRSR